MESSSQTHASRAIQPIRTPLSILISSLFLFSIAGTAAAETIVYDGSDPSMLATDPYSGAGLGLYPQNSTSGNSVTINGGTIPRSAYGGASLLTGSADAEASHNTIIMNAGGIANPSVVQDYLYGGFVQDGGSTGNGTASHNSVTVNGGTIMTGVLGGSLFSGSGDATASHNSITINGGSFVDRIGRHVIYGGWANSISGTATVANNSVTINAGSFAGGDINGGFADSTSGTATVTNNSVTINAGSFNGTATDIYGGRALSSGTATNNSVTLSGNPTFGGTSNLWGGYVSPTVHTAAFSGNTLNILNPIASPMTNIQNFERLYLTISPTAPAISTGTLVLGDGASGQTTIASINATGATPLIAGQTYTVIGATTTTGTPAATTATGQHGIALNYTFDSVAAASGTGVTARVASVGVNQNANALTQGTTAKLSQLDRSADLMMTQVLPQIAAQTRGGGTTAFLATSGGSFKSETGSHNDAKGYSLMAGGAWGAKVASGDLSVGAFVEVGRGDYTSSNSYAGMPAIRGSGDTRFIGVGGLFRLGFASGLYTDASVRVGRAESDFSSANLQFGGNRAKYDSESTYVGAHIGLGYEMKLANEGRLDLSTRYLWTRVDGDKVNILGDEFKFNAANSSRVRTGFRYTHTTAGNFKPYAGLYYDYEMDGKAKGSVLGYKLKGTDVGGGTGVAELGMMYYPTNRDDMSLNLNLQGHAGQRDGFAGILAFSMRF